MLGAKPIFLNLSGGGCPKVPPLFKHITFEVRIPETEWLPVGAGPLGGQEQAAKAIVDRFSV
jgi:hypothetical protein